jgi:hypothetical protein
VVFQRDRMVGLVLVTYLGEPESPATAMTLAQGLEEALARQGL